VISEHTHTLTVKSQPNYFAVKTCMHRRITVNYLYIQLVFAQHNVFPVALPPNKGERAKASSIQQGITPP